MDDKVQWTTEGDIDGHVTFVEGVFMRTSIILKRPHKKAKWTLRMYNASQQLEDTLISTTQLPTKDVRVAKSMVVAMAQMGSIPASDERIEFSAHYGMNVIKPEAIAGLIKVDT